MSRPTPSSFPVEPMHGNCFHTCADVCHIFITGPIVKETEASQVHIGVGIIRNVVRLYPLHNSLYITILSYTPNIPC